MATPAQLKLLTGLSGWVVVAKTADRVVLNALTEHLHQLRAIVHFDKPGKVHVAVTECRRTLDHLGVVGDATLYMPQLAEAAAAAGWIAGRFPLTRFNKSGGCDVTCIAQHVAQAAAFYGSFYERKTKIRQMSVAWWTLSFDDAEQHVFVMDTGGYIEVSRWPEKIKVPIPLSLPLLVLGLVQAIHRVQQPQFRPTSCPSPPPVVQT